MSRGGVSSSLDRCPLPMPTATCHARRRRLKAHALHMASTATKSVAHFDRSLHLSFAVTFILCLPFSPRPLSLSSLLCLSIRLPRAVHSRGGNITCPLQLQQCNVESIVQLRIMLFVMMASFLLPDLPTLTLLVILSSLGKLFCEVGLPNISLAFFPQLHPAGMATDGAPLMEEGRTGARSGVDGAKPSFLKALFIKELKSLALPSHATSWAPWTGAGRAAGLEN